MMHPAWLLDIFATLMLVVAAVSAARLAAARLPAGRLSAVESTRSRSWLRGLGGADTDIAHLLMCVAMAGMLVTNVKTLPSHAWEAIFGVLTAWFAWRSARDAMNGVRSPAAGHCALHVFHCGAMMYMFAALTTSDGMDMSQMDSGAARSLEYPGLALVFALVLVCYSVWDLAQLSVRRYRVGVATSAGAAPDGDTAPTAGAALLTATAPSNTTKFGGEASSPVTSDATLPVRALLLSPAATVACRIALGVAMAFMLLIMK